MGLCSLYNSNTKIVGTILAQFRLNFRVFNLNYSRLILQSSGHRATERPLKIIIINIGGGIQEILGFYLKNNIKYKPMIICTGAAISCLAKDQAPINNFIDKIYLGWLLRIIFHPSAFFPRYIYAFKLFFLVLKNKITISFN